MVEWFGCLVEFMYVCLSVCLSVAGSCGKGIFNSPMKETVALGRPPGDVFRPWNLVQVVRA